MNALLLVTVYTCLVMWLLFAFARLQAAWEGSQRRTGELRQMLAAAGRKLLTDLETVQRLDTEIERVKESTATALREQKDRHEALAKSAPPPPPEVYVPSEYPPSRQDMAWIVDFVRDSDLAPQPWERAPKTSLVWGRTPSAALDRGRQLTAEHKMYRVENVRPLL